MTYDIATLKPVIAPGTLDQIISLLDDDSDLVRTAIARSLGTIGPSAVSAVPALERAFAKGLEHVQLSGIDGVVVGGSYSVDAICAALEKIGSRNLPQGCMNGLYNPP